MKHKSQFLEKLKKQTFEVHHKAHALEYFRVLMKGDAHIKSYLTQLHALAIVLAALEREIQKLTVIYPSLLPKDYASKLPFLLDDIAYLHSKTDEKVIVSVIQASLKVVDNIMILGAKDPLSLLGYLYTVEGSLQGGQVLQKYFKQQFQLDANKGTSYFACYGNKNKEVWSAFKDSFANLIVTQKKEQANIETSLQAFDGLIMIYSEIHKVDENILGYHSAAFNPEAGQHDVPQSKELIQIAKKSNEICWYEFPYFEFRYKERGYRFGLTSNLWFLNLVDVEFELAKSQLLWLVQVIASRGIPSIIMERQLHILDEELNKHANTLNKKHRNFIKVADFLLEKRTEVLEVGRAEELAKAFERTSDREYNRILKDVGSLIVSSVIDEKLGYKNAVDALKNFLCDEKIFSKVWVKDVKDFYTRVQSEVNS